MEPSYHIKSIRLITGLGLGCSVVLYCLVLRWVCYVLCFPFELGLYECVARGRMKITGHVTFSNIHI